MALSPLNKRFATEPLSAINWTVMAPAVDGDAIRCLIDALTTADKLVALDIEHQLVKSGVNALPQVLDALAGNNPMQQATCAMVLLRWQAVDALKEWAKTHPAHNWKVNTLLSMMAQPVEANTRKPKLSVV